MTVPTWAKIKAYDLSYPHLRHIGADAKLRNSVDMPTISAFAGYIPKKELDPDLVIARKIFASFFTDGVISDTLKGGYDDTVAVKATLKALRGEYDR